MCDKSHMKHAHLILACLILVPLAACKSVPPEVTVGRAGDGHGGILTPDPQAGAGASAGLDDLADDDEDADDDAPLATPVQTTTVGANGCKNTTVNGVPVVGRCRRIGNTRTVAATSKQALKAKKPKDGRHHAPQPGDDGYGDGEVYTGEHKLTGWAAHTAPDTKGSTFDNVAGLFSDKQSYWMYHRTLPPGSLVEVAANRRKVRLNVYRGDPPGGYHGRVAVLNYPAAARLDMLRRGRAWVKMRIIREGPP